MPVRTAESFQFGGVDSRSNPFNYPHDRALRCVNWTPRQSGELRLRDGYTLPAMADADAGGPDDAAIHSSVYCELENDSPMILYGEGTALNKFIPATGIFTELATLTSSNRWGHFRASGKIFFSNAVEFKMYDGVNLRDAGLPAPIGVDALFSVTGFAGTTSINTITGILEWSAIIDAVGPPDHTSATSAATTDSAPTNTAYVVFQDFGLAVPVGTIISGIQVAYTRGASATGSVTDYSIRLVKGGVVQGAERADGSRWINVPVDTFATRYAGGATDMWGLAISPADANSSDFGVAIAALVASNDIDEVKAMLDGVQITVYYTATTVSASASTVSAGGFSTTTLTGYQFYMSIYNPSTGHIGNRRAIGNRVAVSTVDSSIILSGLPDYSTFDLEWVKLIGRTADGGEVPYALIDDAGNFVVALNSATIATITSALISGSSELPINNDKGAGFDKFAKTLDLFLAGKPNDHFLYVSGSESEAVQGTFMGNPEESWSPGNAEATPTGESITALHSYNSEGWVFTANHLNIYSPLLRRLGSNPWRGPWPGGCAGQRAFVETPRGPFWVTPEKELVTFSNGIVPVSGEYEAALLAKIDDDVVSEIEVTYHRDPQRQIERIYIKGEDSDGDAVVIVHDFLIADSRSPYGQAYEFQYTSMVPKTFVGAGYSPRFPMKDTSSRERLWAGTLHGRFAQLETGNSDNGTVYAADYLNLMNLGINNPLVAEIEWQGDPNLEVSYLVEGASSLGDFTEASPEMIDVDESRSAVKVKRVTRYIYTRFQLTAHPDDGDFELTDVPFLPRPTYGNVSVARMKLGREQPEGR